MVVSGVFAGVSLLIAVVGVAGVLAFSVSARTREFGIRLAVGSAPRHLLIRVIAEGLSPDLRDVLDPLSREIESLVERIAEYDANRASEVYPKVALLQ